MKELEIHPELERFERTVYVADGPIDFATWLDLSHAVDSDLIQGVIVQKMAAQYPHEWIYMWLSRVVGDFVEAQNLGKILGSRMAVKISNTGGRLPDLVFVRADNLGIIQKDAIYGVPDLVIEIVSENDRPAHLITLENDYRTLGVSEIVFIDPRKKRVRVVTKTDAEYDDTVLTMGQLTFASVPGFAIEVEWLFADDKPVVHHIVAKLLASAGA